MKKGLLIVLGIIVLGIVLFVSVFGGTYNNLVTHEENVKKAWSQVENVYQRRLDLIPNLVETVKGYAAHEQETLQGITDARAKVGQMTVTSDVVNNPEAFQQFQQSQGALTSFLSRLLAVSERYPDLKANQNFLNLQSQLEGTENRISVERGRYNEAAQAFNTVRRSFPTVVVAGFMGFKEKSYFTADQGAAKAPKVEF